MARHPADFLSLIFGLVFAIVGALLLVGGVDALSLGWIGPAAAIGLGALLILGARSGGAAPTELPEED